MNPNIDAQRVLEGGDLACVSVAYNRGFPGAKHVDRLRGKQQREFHMTVLG